MRPLPQVLLVDDKEAVRESLQLALDGFDCVFSDAGTGAAALNLIRANAFDVIFLDLRLPDIDGMDVFRKATKIRPDLGHVIILTALPDVETEAEAKSLGAFKYLHKPLSYEQVRAVFAEATSHTPRLLVPDISAGKLFASLKDPRPSQRGLPRVLVLDDRKLWLDQIQEALEGDFDLLRTTDDVDACRWANNEPIKLAVIDMNLARGVSGLDVLGRMRMANPDLRAVMLSDFPDYRSPLDLKSAIAYVSKKDIETLSSTINSILSEPLGPIRVFLSYDTGDRDRVSEIYGELVGRGYLPWMDYKSITPGKDWRLEVHHAIERAHRFVFCLSGRSAIKEGMLLKELRHALDKQSGLRENSIFIIAARLEGCDPMPLLEKFQHVDLFLPDGMAKLLAALSSER